MIAKKTNPIKPKPNPIRTQNEPNLYYPCSACLTHFNAKKAPPACTNGALYKENHPAYRRHAALRTIKGGICRGRTCFIFCLTQLRLLGYKFTKGTFIRHGSSYFFFSHNNIFTPAKNTHNHCCNTLSNIDPFTTPLNRSKKFPVQNICLFALFYRPHRYNRRKTKTQEKNYGTDKP